MATLGVGYRKLWTATALSNLADGIFQVALPLLALRITRSPVEIAGVMLAARLPWLLVALPAGALADRLDRRLTMLNVNLVRAALIGALAVVAAVEAERLWVLYAIAFALGVGETLFDTAAQSILPSVVQRADLSRANGRLSAAEVTANRFVGPPLGGLLVGLTMALAFVGSAACYLCGAVAIALIAGRFRPRQVGASTSLRTDIAEGLRYVFRHRLLRRFALIVAATNLSITACLAVLPVFAVAPGPMDLSALGFGLLLAGGAVGALVGAFAVPHLAERLGRARTLQLGVLGAAAVCAAPLLVHPLLVVLVLAYAGFGEMCWDIVTVSLRQSIAPDAMLGRVNASFRLVAYGTMPIGAAIGGVLGASAGVRWVFAVGGIACLALLLGLRAVTNEAMAAAEAAT